MNTSSRGKTIPFGKLDANASLDAAVPVNCSTGSAPHTRTYVLLYTATGDGTAAYRGRINLSKHTKHTDAYVVSMKITQRSVKILWDNSPYYSSGTIRLAGNTAKISNITRTSVASVGKPFAAAVAARDWATAAKYATAKALKQARANRATVPANRWTMFCATGDEDGYPGCTSPRDANDWRIFMQVRWHSGTWRVVYVDYDNGG